VSTARAEDVADDKRSRVSRRPIFPPFWTSLFWTSLSPNPCQSVELRAEWSGRNHVGDLARSRQGRTLSSRVSEQASRQLSREMLISPPARSPAPLASRCQLSLLLFGISTSWLIWGQIKRYLSHLSVLCIAMFRFDPWFNRCTSLYISW